MAKQKSTRSNGERDVLLADSERMRLAYAATQGAEMLTSRLRLMIETPTTDGAERLVLYVISSQAYKLVSSALALFCDAIYQPEEARALLDSLGEEGRMFRETADDVPSENPPKTVLHG